MKALRLCLLVTLLSLAFPVMAFADGEWALTAAEHRGKERQFFVYACPPMATLPTFSVWGTDIYTDDSSVCMAAVHAGQLTIAGGAATIQILPGQASYAGSTRFGVSSLSFGAYAGSFSILGAIPGDSSGHVGRDPAKKIPILSAEGFPNNRRSNDPVENAIDGKKDTWTWTTEAWNVMSESYLAIGFDSHLIGSLSLWKSNAGGGGENIKDLTIDYTIDGGALSSRAWIRLSGVTNGFNGAELLKATTVNADGTVIGDIHNSEAGDGWGSLSFTPVAATGLRIGFKNQNVYGGCGGGVPVSGCNHYRVGEFEVYAP